MITIDIPNRSLRLDVDADVLAQRRARLEAGVLAAYPGSPRRPASMLTPRHP